MNRMQLDFQLPQPPNLSSFQALFDLYLVIGTAVAIVVIGWFLYNIIKHRERPHMPPSQHAEGKPETWRTALTMVLITASILAIVETATFLSTNSIFPSPAPNAIHINVTAQRFYFNFTYPNGNSTTPDLWIPAGQQVILNITSKDVNHSLGIVDIPNPVKAAAIAGQFNIAYLQVSQIGTYTIRCYELCGGSGHYAMFGKLHVVDPTAYAQLHYGG